MTTTDRATTPFPTLNIGCVTRHPYPTEQEVRVTKFAKSLASLGHQFFVFCPAGDQQSTTESFEYGRIVRLKGRFSRSIGALLYSPVPINPLWTRWLRRQFQNCNLNIVIVRDLRLALPVFSAARACRIKVILDLGEHYPGMMELLGKQTLSHHIIRNHSLIARLESYSVSKADRVWVVVDENKARLRRYSQRITVINNYPESIQTGGLAKVVPRPYSDSGEPVTLISFGLIDNIRGLDLAIDAFAIIERELRNVQLSIFGDGFFKSELEEQVNRLGLEDKVVFGGWVPASRKYEHMATGDIGLILHKVCDLTQHTVPNKLFDYMSVGLPVVSTDMGPVRRILDSEDCGIAVGESASLVAGEVKTLILDVERRKRFAENGYQAVGLRYRWKDEEEKIIHDIRELTPGVE